MCRYLNKNPFFLDHEKKIKMWTDVTFKKYLILQIGGQLSSPFPKKRKKMKRGKLTTDLGHMERGNFFFDRSKKKNIQSKKFRYMRFLETFNI